MTAPLAASPSTPPILEVDSISVHFKVRRGLFDSATVHAVDGISFTLARGETLGLVGESGSGKSTTGRAVVQIESLTSGVVRLDGLDLGRMRGRQLRRERHKFQMIFQDPYGSLNPRHTIERIIAEPLEINGGGSRASNRAAVHELLVLVGLDPSFAGRYPFALSGGQRQRVAIARALSAKPELVVCDEPVSALDVSIQAQIVNLLKRLQSELHLAYLFIGHDLSVVRYIADRVAVMYLGQIVELATSDELYARPAHPYTQALLSAVPVPNAERERGRRRIILRGEIPSPTNPPSGCRFHTRCWLRERLGSPVKCATDEPPLAPVTAALDSVHVAACHFIEEAATFAQVSGVISPIATGPVSRAADGVESRQDLAPLDAAR